MKKLIALAILVFAFCQIKAQVLSKNDLTGNFTFNDSSIDRKMILPVTKSIVNIHFFFKMRVTEGSVTVEIKDPEGKYEGGFRVTGDGGTENEDKVSKGEMTHDVSFPIQGNWSIHIQSNHAAGTLSYEIKPSYN